MKGMFRYKMLYKQQLQWTRKPRAKVHHGKLLKAKGKEQILKIDTMHIEKQWWLTATFSSGAVKHRK